MATEAKPFTEVDIVSCVLWTANHPGHPHFYLSHREAVVLAAEIERLQAIEAEASTAARMRANCDHEDTALSANTNAEALALWEEWFEAGGDFVCPLVWDGKYCFFCRKNIEPGKSAPHANTCIGIRAHALVDRVRGAE